MIQLFWLSARHSLPWMPPPPHVLMRPKWVSMKVVCRWIYSSEWSRSLAELFAADGIGRWRNAVKVNNREAGLKKEIIWWPRTGEVCLNVMFLLCVLDCAHCSFCWGVLLPVSLRADLSLQFSLQGCRMPPRRAQLSPPASLSCSFLSRFYFIFHLQDFPPRLTPLLLFSFLQRRKFSFYGSRFQGFTMCLLTIWKQRNRTAPPLFFFF